MYKYRISKYNPNNRNRSGSYLCDEWTSFSDIGKTFNGLFLTKEIYLKTEDYYCDIILEILKCNRVEEVFATDLEKYFSIKEIRAFFSEHDLTLTAMDENVLYAIKEGDKIQLKDLRTYIKLILRECFWCRFLGDPFPIKIEFGYDFYVYIETTVPLSDSLKSKFSSNGIYVEDMVQNISNKIQAKEQ